MSRFLVLSYSEVDAQSASHTERLLNGGLYAEGRGVPDDYDVIAIHRRRDGDSNRGSLEVICERRREIPQPPAPRDRETPIILAISLLAVIAMVAALGAKAVGCL